MCQQGVDLARFRDEIVLRLRIVRITAADVTNKTLEIVDVAINRSTEFIVTAVFAADVIEALLTLQRIEVAREHFALTTPVAIPGVEQGFAIDGVGNAA